MISEIEKAKVWSNFSASDKSNNPLGKGKIDQKPREESKTSTSKKLVEKVKSLKQFFQIIKNNFTINDSEIEVLKNSSSEFEFKFPAYREDKFWGNCTVSFKESLSFKIDSHTNEKIINHRYRLLLKLKNEKGFEFHSQAKPFKKDDPVNTFLLLFQILFEDLEKQDDGLPF